MGNYQFTETVDGDDGEQYEFPVLVHELFSRPHKVIGVPGWASDEQIDQAITNLEEKLGYELERANDLRISDEEAAEYYPKQAGFHPVTGEFMAR